MRACDSLVHKSFRKKYFCQALPAAVMFFIVSCLEASTFEEHLTKIALNVLFSWHPHGNLVPLPHCFHTKPPASAQSQHSNHPNPHPPNPNPCPTLLFHATLLPFPQPLPHPFLAFHVSFLPHPYPFHATYLFLALPCPIPCPSLPPICPSFPFHATNLPCLPCLPFHALFLAPSMPPICHPFPFHATFLPPLYLHTNLPAAGYSRVLHPTGPLPHYPIIASAPSCLPPLR